MVLGAEVYRQTSKSSDLELNSTGGPLTSDSWLSCLRGSSYNTTHILGSFFLGMMSLQNWPYKRRARENTSTGSSSKLSIQQHPKNLSSQVRMHCLDKWKQAFPQQLSLLLEVRVLQPACRQSGNPAPIYRLETL